MNRSKLHRRFVISEDDSHCNCSSHYSCTYNHNIEALESKLREDEGLTPTPCPWALSESRAVGLHSHPCCQADSWQPQVCDPAALRAPASGYST